MLYQLSYLAPVGNVNCSGYSERGASSGSTRMAGIAAATSPAVDRPSVHTAPSRTIIPAREGTREIA